MLLFLGTHPGMVLSFAILRQKNVFAKSKFTRMLIGMMLDNNSTYLKNVTHHVVTFCAFLLHSIMISDKNTMNKNKIFDTKLISESNFPNLFFDSFEFCYILVSFPVKIITPIILPEAKIVFAHSVCSRPRASC